MLQREKPLILFKKILNKTIAKQIVFVTIALTTSCSAQADSFWSPALGMLTKDQLSAIVAENSSIPIGKVPDSMIKGMRSHQERNLFIIDFNSQTLCGHAGCLYVGYALNEQSKQLRKVLQFRANPALPPGTPLITIAPEQTGNLPCFEINQLNPTRPNQLMNYLLCSMGDRYVVQHRIAKPIQNGVSR